MFNLIRSAFDALLPPGNLWEPELGKGFDQQLNGISDSIEEVKEIIDTLAHIRNPDKTSIFEDLERNYGIKPNPNISLEKRVARLAQKVYQGARINSIDDLQADLDRAGFDLLVHKNDPPVDPAPFLEQTFQMTAGSDYAYAGFNDGTNILSFANHTGGELIVNPPVYLQSPGYAMCAGGDVAYAGFTFNGVQIVSVAGYSIVFTTELSSYPIPTNPGYWPLIFFVGGPAIRDPETGELLEIVQGNVDFNRKDELKALILSNKMIGAWCALIVTYN